MVKGSEGDTWRDSRESIVGVGVCRESFSGCDSRSAKGGGCEGSGVRTVVKGLVRTLVTASMTSVCRGIG